MGAFKVEFPYEIEYACTSRDREREFGRAYLLSDGRVLICLYDELEPSKEYETMALAKEDYVIF